MQAMRQGAGGHGHNFWQNDAGDFKVYAMRVQAPAQGGPLMEVSPLRALLIELGRVRNPPQSMKRASCNETIG